MTPPLTVLAIGLWLLFFLVAFVGRSILQWQRTGDSGFRLSKDLGITARLATLLMVVGMLGGFLGALADALDILDEVHSLQTTRVQTAGIALMVLAIVATAKAQMDLRDSWRIGVDAAERTELVTTGIYAAVRNPIFSGMFLFSVGGALATPNWPALLMSFVALVGFQLQVRGVEEPYLDGVHGDTFRRYANRSGRFLPGLGRLPTTPSG